MIHVFTIDECTDIINGNTNDYYIQKAKNKVIEYLESKNIVITEPKYLIHIISKSSTNGAKSWHYDDDSLINFIINIKGSGTKILIDGKIEELLQGYGYMVIGEEGYKFLNIKPTLHCAPKSDENRLLLKIMLCANFNLSDYVLGPSVCSYNSPEYNTRNEKLDLMLNQDIQIFNSLISQNI